MAEAKTKPTKVSVARFIDALPDAQKRADSHALVKMMQAMSKAPPVMWGPNIIGFGTWTYQYASGREGDWPVLAFSPRKTSLVLYLTPDVDAYPALMAKLGKHSFGKSCLYVKRLSDVHLPTLRALVKVSMREIRARAQAPA